MFILEKSSFLIASRAVPKYVTSMKNKLPVCPLNDAEGEEAWLDGLDLLLEELKFEEELPFHDAEEIWEEVIYALEDEELVLTDELKAQIRTLFDQLWPQYKA